MFKLAPDTYVPGFRVGLTDDNTESARRPLPAVPSGVASGYDPYSNVLQAMVPTVFRPAGLFYQGGNGLFPTPNQAYVPVSGGSLSQDPLRQAVDGAANPYANSGGLPVPDPLRQAVDRAANPYINRVANPLQLPSDINGQDVGTFVGGLLGAGLGTLIPVPGGPWLGAYVGGRLGRVLGAGTDFTADTMIDAAPLGANPVAP
jgi:hypothetical protein